MPSQCETIYTLEGRVRYRGDKWRVPAIYRSYFKVSDVTTHLQQCQAIIYYLTSMADSGKVRNW